MVWKYEIILPLHIKRQTIDKRSNTVRATPELF